MLLLPINKQVPCQNAGGDMLTCHDCQNGNRRPLPPVMDENILPLQMVQPTVLTYIKLAE